jgi:ABC-2 type transport system ATP-binding protein
MSETANGAVLRFEQIQKRFGDTHAVRGVSFEVRGGEVFGLLGPNGAGKTTLIRTLMDIIRPDSGRIVVFGSPLERSHLDRIGYLPEERGLYNKQKVIDVMVYFGALKGLARDEARRVGLEWLGRVGLSDASGMRVEQLSKGMSQKVQIAVTLMTDPELCVLDEPFSGLDPVNVRLVRELIGDRRNRGRATILSTHQMNMVEELCDRVALIDKGQLVVYGGVDEVRRQYSIPEVRVTLEGEFPDIDGVGEVRREDDRTWLVLLEDAEGSGDLLQSLVRSGARVERFERVLAPMEDIFVRVVRGGAA